MILEVAVIAGFTLAGERAWKAYKNGTLLTDITSAASTLDGWANRVAHVDQINRVFGKITIGRRHDRHGLADIAHATNRHRPAFDRCLDAHDEA